MVSLQNENSFRFLRVLNNTDLYGRGKANTRTIREATELSEGEIHHQYRTLEEMGLIEIERDPEATPEGQPPMKIAVLTDTAREEIDKGLLVEAEEKYGQDEPDGLDEVAEEIASLRETISELEALPAEVESLEAELESVESDLQEVEEMAKWTGGSGEGVEPERVDEVEEKIDSTRERWNEKISPRLKMLVVTVARMELALEDEGIDVSEIDVPDDRVEEIIGRAEQYK